VTLTVPPALLSAIPPGRLEWGVAGQYRDKIAALIKGLPKRHRKLLVPVGEKAETIAREMPRAPEETPLFKAVSEFVRRRFGVDIPAKEWELADVPRHLRMRVAVVDPATGKVIDAGRDVELLRKKLGAADEAPSKIESPAWQEARLAWERDGLTDWDFGDLPESIAVGTSLTAYPALKMGDMIPISPFSGAGSPEPLAIRLFPTRAEAEAAHRQGVRALLLRRFAKDLAFVRRYHKIPAEHDRAALFFGGREALEKGIEAALARDVLERNIRTQAAFKACEAEAGRTLFDRGHALTQAVVRVVELNAKVRAALGPGSGGGGAKKLGLYELSKLKERVKPEYIDAVAADLDRLVPKDFLALYDIARLVRLPRYLEGLLIRLERARLAPDKDKAKAAQVEPYAFELARLRSAPGRGPALGPGPAPKKEGQGITSPIKQAAIEELRWMIEEFKLALFAPEIKTAFPISAVRLARKIAEIDALG
jgi:ATP-dependent helicase HrpA